MDYFKLLHLEKEPFSNAPDPNLFFHSKQHTECLQHLELSLRLKRGLNVVMGKVGTGKTTLGRQLIQKLSGDALIETHLILDPSYADSLDFLRSVIGLLEADATPDLKDEWALKEAIKNTLFQRGVNELKTVVLIIDEGQKITGDCLEILREFLNYETNDSKLLQIVIFAQTEFEAILAERENLCDRINMIHRLKPLNFSDTRQMIRHRLRQAGPELRPKNIFSFPALVFIYRLTKGYPRKIIHLCHQSLLAMIIQNRSQVGWRTVNSCFKRTILGAPPKISRMRRAAYAFLLVMSISFYHLQNQSLSNYITTIGKNNKIEHYTELRKLVKERHLISENMPRDDLRQSPTIETASGEHLPQNKNNTEVTLPIDRLGYIRIKSGYRLYRMIERIYGVNNPQAVKLYLADILKINPTIKDPLKINIGDKILFPAIMIDVGEALTAKWWIELRKCQDLETAYTVLGRLLPYESNLRIIPYKDQSGQAHFSVVVNNVFSNEDNALEKLYSLSPEAMNTGRVISFQKAYTYYSNPVVTTS